MKIILTDQKRTGVFPAHKRLKFESGAIPTDMRMTSPARDAVERVATVRDGAYYYQRPPSGVVVVLAPVIEAGAPTMGRMSALRLADDPPFSGELENHDMWIEVDLTPCPQCGAALVWYEAGYVPGYRVCAGPQHHHYIASSPA